MSSTGLPTTTSLHRLAPASSTSCTACTSPMVAGLEEGEGGHLTRTSWWPV